MCSKKSYLLFYNYYIYETITKSNNTVTIVIPGISNSSNMLFFVDFINGFYNFYIEKNLKLFELFFNEKTINRFENTNVIIINAKSFGNIICSLLLIEIYKNIDFFPNLNAIKICVMGGMGTHKTLAKHLTQKLLQTCLLNTKLQKIQTNIVYVINSNDPVCVMFCPFIFKNIQNLTTQNKDFLNNITFDLQHNIFEFFDKNKDAYKSYLQQYKNHVYNEKIYFDTQSYSVKTNYISGLNNINNYYNNNIKQHSYFEKHCLFAIINIVKQFYGYNGFFSCLTTILLQQYTSVFTQVYGNINYSVNYENIIKYFYLFRQNIIKQYCIEKNVKNVKNFLLQIFIKFVVIIIKFLKIISLPYYSNNSFLKFFCYVFFQTFQIIQIFQVLLCVLCCSLLKSNTEGLLQIVNLKILLC